MINTLLKYVRSTERVGADKVRKKLLDGFRAGQPWTWRETDLQTGSGRYDYGLSQPDPKMVMHCQTDIDIPVRDGVLLKADLYRPDDDGTYPVIMNLSPYPRRTRLNPGLDDTGGAGMNYQFFEHPSIEYWIPRGYAFMAVSSRGFVGSQGDPAAFNDQEAQDYYDAIEWAAAQSWCDGNVGLFGISYYAYSQYRVATLNPPHLRAIVPWEGLVDPYRDACFRGGIPGRFGRLFAGGVGLLRTDRSREYQFADMVKNLELIDLTDPVSADLEGTALEQITVPMLSVGNLNDPDLHLRGNVEAFRASRGPHKKLLLYSGTHWGSAYQPWANRTVLRFFDHWLKGRDTGLYSEPAVDVQVRTGPGSFTHAYGDQWPLPQTDWTRWYLDASDRSLDRTPADTDGSARGAWTIDQGASRRVSFTTAPLAADVTIAGPLTARLWVSSTGDDADITIEVRDLDEAGRETRFAYFHHDSPDVPVTRGWLRASHRELDADRTLPYRPFHTHARKQPLQPNTPVELDIEIWPSGMVFKAGHRIQLTVHTGRFMRLGDAINHPIIGRRRLPLANIYNELATDRGVVTVHTGPGHPSWLELPVLAASTAPEHRVAIVGGGYVPERPDSARPPRFEPQTTTANLGDRIAWANVSTGYHTASEETLGLWDSQLLRGTNSRNPETWGMPVDWAGSFDYCDRINGARGVLEVPVALRHNPASGDVVVTVASTLPTAAGFCQVRYRPVPSASSAAEDWQELSTPLGATEVMIESPGPGTLEVQCRWSNGTTTTRWSPTAMMTVPARTDHS